jgi:hypothetical protein
VDWKEAEKQLAPLLTDPGEWQRLRGEFEKREVTMLTLVGDNPDRPYFVQGTAGRGGLRIAGVDWRRADAVRDALESSLPSSTLAPRPRPSASQAATGSGRRDAANAEGRSVDYAHGCSS